MGLSIHQITKRYGATNVADAVSIDFEESEFFTLLGQSGSGKSTLLRIIAGLDIQDSGEVLLDGGDLTGVPPWKRPVGMVFQSYAVFPHMSVAKNVGYGLTVRGIRKKEIAKTVDRFLDLVELSGYGERRIATLSGGEQQRVALARALAVQPRILLLDEPLSALDEKIRRSAQTFLRRLQKESGATFIYVTHDQEEALSLSDRIALLNDGRLEQVATAKVMYEEPKSRYVASFFRGWSVLDASADICRLMEPHLDLSAACAVGIRNDRIALSGQSDRASIVLNTRFASAAFRGAFYENDFVLPDGQSIRVRTEESFDFSVDENVSLYTDPRQVRVFHD